MIIAVATKRTAKASQPVSVRFEDEENEILESVSKLYSVPSRNDMVLKIENLQLLDLRRTLASYLYRLHRRQEVDDLTIKALLNHYDGRPVAVYTRLDVDSLAKILQGYADWLWGLSTN